MTASVLDRVRAIAADVLNIPERNIGPESSPETIDAWDSVHHLNLVLALEQDFDIQFEPEEIDQMKNIAQIAAVLDPKVESKQTDSK
jgi:acyl carrier protein